MGALIGGAALAALVLGALVVGRLLRGAGTSVADQVAAAAAQYGEPEATLASADVPLGGRAAIEAVSRGAELSVWLEHAVEKQGGMFSEADWSLVVLLTTAAGEQRIVLAYDGEDVRVTPRQLGVTGLPSAWPGGYKTRIATLPPAPAGARVAVQAAIQAQTPIASARLAISIATA